MTAPQLPPPPAPRGPRRLAGWLAFGAVFIAAAAATAYWLSHPRSSSTPANPPTKQPPDPPAPPAEPPGPPYFRDVTAGSGIDFTYRNGEEADQFTILESLGGGVALLDFDGDGLLDVFVTGGGSFDGPDRKQVRGLPCRLYRNLGGWKFEDVTEKVGLAGVSWWYTHGAAVADYDMDGWPDLLVTGYGRLALFHNEPDGKGGRRFTDVTAAVGLNDSLWSTGAGWADLDGDGFPDLYVCHYCDWSPANNPPCAGQSPGVEWDICPPHRFRPQAHALFHNEQGKAFRDVSADHDFRADSYGLGVVLADLNGDGRPDVYVTNDMTRNLLFLNRGGGRLEEKAIPAGVALDENGRATASMGVDAGEYDGSGRPALFVTNFQQELPSLYQNLGRERFYYQSPAAGLAALGRSSVSWGTAFVDFDNDGYPDLVIANGHLFRRPAGTTVKQRPQLLRNVARDGRRAFADAGGRGGTYFQTPAVGRGLAVGDLDNDGWPDLVVSHTNSPASVLRNEAAADARWLGIRLVGKGNRCVVGSTAMLEVGGRTLTRFAKGGGSYLSAGDARLPFGLGADGRPGRLTVQWAWGEAQTWDGLEPGAYYELREGEAKAVRGKGP